MKRFLIVCCVFFGIGVTQGQAAGKSAKAVPQARKTVAKVQKKEVTGSKNCDSVCRELVAATLLRSAMDFAANDLKIVSKRYLVNLLKLYPKTNAAAKARVWAKTPGLFLDQTGRVEFPDFDISQCFLCSI